MPPTTPGESKKPYRLTYEAGAPARAAARPSQTPQPAEVAAPRERSSPRQASKAQKTITLAIASVALLAMVVSLVLGNVVTAIVVSIIALTVLQGLWRGAAEVFGIVVAMFVAVLLAPPLGGLFEGVTSSLFNTGGIMNRLLSMGMAALLVTVAIAGGAGALARRFLKKRPDLQAINRHVGAALGLVEGVFLSLLLLWSLFMLEPIARSQAAGDQPNPLAERVVRVTDEARRSTFAAVAQATNPLSDMELVALLTDFAHVTAHPEAREHLLASDPVKRLQNLPALIAAMDRVKADPELAGLIDEDGLTPDDVKTFLNSPTVLKIVDDGAAARELKPLAEDLKKAIREAKARIGPG